MIQHSIWERLPSCIDANCKLHTSHLPEAGTAAGVEQRVHELQLDEGMKPLHGQTLVYTCLHGSALQCSLIAQPLRVRHTAKHRAASMCA